MKQKLKIGLVGCGAIGSYLAKRIDKDLKKTARLVSICDIDKTATARLKKSLRQKPLIYNQPTLIKKSDLIIEAANIAACSKLLDSVISARKDILVMSVGALLKRPGLIEKAGKKGSKIYIPSGAIAGVDAFKAARLSKIKSVRLITRKPAKTLADITYIQKKGIDLKKIKKPLTVFKGDAVGAIANFPKNINVSAILSMSTLGPRKTSVEIIADPNLKRNIHEIKISGDFGDITTRLENVASPENPKTSYLAMLSAYATLKGILSPIRIGT